MFKKTVTIINFICKKLIYYWKKQITQSRSSTEEALTLEWSHNEIISQA